MVPTGRDCEDCSSSRLRLNSRLHFQLHVRYAPNWLQLVSHAGESSAGVGAHVGNRSMDQLLQDMLTVALQPNFRRACAAISGRGYGYHANHR